MRNLDKSILRTQCLKAEFDWATTTSAGKAFQSSIARLEEKNFLVFNFARRIESLQSSFSGKEILIRIINYSLHNDAVELFFFIVLCELNGSVLRKQICYRYIFIPEKKFNSNNYLYRSPLSNVHYGRARTVLYAFKKSGRSMLF